MDFLSTMLLLEIILLLGHEGHAIFYWLSLHVNMGCRFDVKGRSRENHAHQTGVFNSPLLVVILTVTVRKAGFPAKDKSSPSFEKTEHQLYSQNLLILFI